MLAGVTLQAPPLEMFTNICGNVEQVLFTTSSNHNLTTIDFQPPLKTALPSCGSEHGCVLVCTRGVCECYTQFLCLCVPGVCGRYWRQPIQCFIVHVVSETEVLFLRV